MKNVLFKHTFISQNFKKVCLCGYEALERFKRVWHDDGSYAGGSYTAHWDMERHLIEMIYLDALERRSILSPERSDV